MSKKRKIVIRIMVVVVVIFAGIFVWERKKLPRESPSGTYRVEYTLVENSDGWYINITNTIKENGGVSVYKFKAEEVRYKLYDSTGYPVDPPQFNTSNIVNINGTSSLQYNITWNDIDKDGMLSIGDNFFISKTGGVSGVAKAGYGFLLDFGGCLLMSVRL